jgi:uncharacterized protein
MNFEWDEHRATLNKGKHDFAFSTAARLFSVQGFKILDSARESDNEPRLKGIGYLDGRLFTVLFTKRGESIRIISARRSNKTEIKEYGDS